MKNKNTSTPKPLGNDIKALIQRANGATVMLQAGGSYSGFNISGIKAPIVIDGNGATVNNQMKFEDCGKVTLKNIKIKNGNQYGVMVVNCAGFTAEGLIITDPQRSGILTANTPNVDIGNCRISGAKEQHGIYCSQSGDFLRIHDNIIENCAFSGVQVNAVQDDANPNADKNHDSISENVFILDNTIINCQRVGHAGAIQLSGVHTGQVKDNKVQNHNGRNIATLWDDGSNNPRLACKDVEISGNTARFADSAKAEAYVSIGKNCTYTLGINSFPGDRAKELVNA